MTKRSKLVASTAISPFAHLNPAAVQPRAEEPDDNREPGAENDEPNPDDDKAKKGKKAKKAETPDDDEGDDEGDDETDAEDERDDEMAAARRRERGRCAAIFSSAAAGRNPAAAAELAFGTTLPRSQALRVLGSLPAPPAAPAAPEPQRPGASLRQRMQNEQVAAVGPNGGQAELTPGQRLVQRAGNRAYQGGN